MTSPDAISEARLQLLERLRRGELPTSTVVPEPLNSRPTDVPVPLSPGQEQIWFHDHLAAGAPIYNESVTIHKRGPLDPVVLERCFNEIVRRHEIWRSAFPMIDGKAALQIDETVRVSLPLIDLSDLPVEEREAESVRIATEDASRHFDLNVAPLFRVRLIRWSEDYHRIYLTVHHLVFDGVSIYRVLIAELAALYSAFSAGLPSPLPELAVQYGDYAWWKQKQLADGSANAAQLKYWREILSEDLPSLELPADRPRPAEPSWRGGMETCTIPADLIDALKKVGKSEGVTLYMLLLAALQVLLYRYSGQDEVVVGGATNTRTRPEVEALMGYFLNAIVFRSQIAADLTFRQFLERVKNTVLGALANSEIPFDAIVRELAPKRDSSRHPMFQVLFSMRPPFSDFPEGWDVTDMEIHSGASTFDLFVEFSEHPQGLAGRCVYSSDLFDSATIQRLLRNFQTLLQELAANPDQAIARVPLLTAAEQHTLLVDWNHTSRTFPSLPIHELFEAKAAASPSHPALVFRGQQLTYEELNARANKLANYLLKNGVRSGSFVGLYMERSFEMVVALLAVLKSGAAYVPYDPELPLARLNGMLDDSSPACVITQKKLSGNLAGYAGQTILLDSMEGLEGQPDSNPGLLVAPSDAIYAIYTSGSTGFPKAAINSHAAVANRILWMQDAYPMHSGDRVLQKTPYSFDVSVWEFFWPIICGATLVIAEPAGHKDTAYLANLIGDERITTIHFVPSMLREFLEARDLARCGSLQRVFASGEALPPDLLPKFFQRLGAKLHNLYGPTEAAVDVTYWDCINPAPCATVPIGRPISNVTAYILDRNLAPVPIGVAGELHIGGVAVALGYLNRPELTAARFIPDPFAKDPQARLYKTGDRARFLADGNIEYLGRLDNQVKLRGFRIELGEIESEILKSDQVQAAVVVLREDSPIGKALIAYVVPGGPGLDTPSMRAALKDRLPEYMIPSQFVFLDALPQLANGKINRAALPVPHQWSTAPADQYVPPSDSIERQLVDIWETLLGTSPIGVNHNFFELGGHSMLLAKMLFQVERTFHQNLSMATVFQKPTIAELAALLRDENAPPQPCRVFPIQAEGSRPAFICLGAGAYFIPLARRLGNDQPLMGVDLTDLETDQLPVPARLQDIGAFVVKAILEFQPQGPYYLGGWCLYGVLMYEVAQQLRAQGAEVALLVMFDSINPAHKGALPFWTEMQVNFQKWLYLATLLGKLKPREVPEYLSQRMRMLGNRLSRFFERRAYNRSIHNADGPLQMELDPVFFVACTNYTPKPYAGHVVHYQAVERPHGRHWDLRYVWQDLIRGPFETYDVVGGHDGMFREPHVAVLGKRLKSSLAQAQKRPYKDELTVSPSGALDRFGYSVPGPEVAGALELKPR